MTEKDQLKMASLEPIKSRFILLGFQAVLCFSLGFTMLWITTIRPVVSFSTEEISPLLFNVLRFGVTVLLTFWGLFFMIKAVRCRVSFTPDKMIVRQSFQTTTIDYDTITEFIWKKGTARLAGIIPFISVSFCTITGEHYAPLATLSTLDYKDLKPRIQALEVQLTNEPIL